jgi:protein involved in polysaccharide export with SLBB domain
MIAKHQIDSTAKAPQRRLMSAIAGLFVVSVVAGCSSSASTASMPLQSDYMPEPVYSVQQGEYRIAPGDELSVHFMFHQDLDAGQLRVRREGEVTLSGLGEFYVAGLTAAEFEQAIYRRASLTYRNPEVSVEVTGREAYRAYVGGEVRRPGYVDIRPGLTSMRAIFERGGFLDTAKLDNVLHVRWDDDGRYTARIVDVKTMLETGDSRLDVQLTPNDVVFIPKTRIANANLWVSQYVLKLIPVRPPTTRFPEFDGPWSSE